MTDVNNLYANVKHLNDTSAGAIAKKLDAQDGKADGKISGSVWNSFNQQNNCGGKEVKNYISVENALKSITTYLVRQGNGDKTKVEEKAKEWSASLDASNPPEVKNGQVNNSETEVKDAEPQASPENDTPGNQRDLNNAAFAEGMSDESNWKEVPVQDPVSPPATNPDPVHFDGDDDTINEPAPQEDNGDINPANDDSQAPAADKDTNVQGKKATVYVANIDGSTTNKSIPNDLAIPNKNIKSEFGETEDGKETMTIEIGSYNKQGNEIVSKESKFNQMLEAGKENTANPDSQYESLEFQDKDGNSIVTIKDGKYYVEDGDVVKEISAKKAQKLLKKNVDNVQAYVITNKAGAADNTEQVSSEEINTYTSKDGKVTCKDGTYTIKELENIIGNIECSVKKEEVTKFIKDKLDTIIYTQIFNKILLPNGEFLIYGRKHVNPQHANNFAEIGAKSDIQYLKDNKEKYLDLEKKDKESLTADEKTFIQEYESKAAYFMTWTKRTN